MGDITNAVLIIAGLIILVPVLIGGNYIIQKQINTQSNVRANYSASDTVELNSC